MSYDRLYRRLADPPSPTMSTLPDGSVDHLVSIAAGGRGPVASRSALAEEIADPDRSSFRLRVDTTEPGGQAVNVATQVHALGGHVTCYGHLDDPVFDGLPFETVSQGEPATVYALNFDDGDVMLAENTEVEGWTVADLERVADLRAIVDTDAVCCSNWVTFRGLTALFERLGALEVPRVPFVVDPGDIVGADAATIERFHGGLAALQASLDAVYTANRGEIRASAEVVAGKADTDRERLEVIREATGVTAVILHAADKAAVATEDGFATVANVEVDSPTQYTGGGDRFTGGLGVALAAGWNWDVALACGNAAAVHFVETGETGTVADLRAVAARAT